MLLAFVLGVGAIVAGTVPGGRADAYTTVVYNGAGSAPHISIIGDSTVAALRWANMFDPLKEFNFVYDAESCRRVVITSCRGREGYTPDTVISTMRRLSGQLGSALVLMGGYDDPGSGFATAVDAVMAEAARQGIPHVIWLTLRTADVSYVGPTFSSNTYTFRDNNRILLQKAQQYGGRLQIADWATYSASQSSWVVSDGIHLTASGANAVASYIAAQAARVLGGETITPAPGAVPILPWATIRRGDRGASVVAVQQALIERGYALIGGADGVFGSATETLVRTFQKANGLTVTGVVDAATAARLGLNNAGGVAAPATWVDLKYGMGGTGVAAAQRALAAKGIFVRGGADGVFSVYTTYAVQTFQRRNGVAPTGVIDAATAKLLGLYTGSGWIDLRTGMSGTSVRAAQTALSSSGIYLAGGVTGTFSLGTYYAVKTFQKFQGLPVTGIIDGATARALGLIVAPQPSSVWSNLTVGALGTRVASAQRALMDAGVFVRGGATGRYDVYSYYATQTFQRRNGLPVTGIVDVATARALGLFDLDDPVVTWRDLRLGSTGDAVTRAERALIAARVHVSNGADAVFGIDTYYAVLTYQRYHGLPVTGIIDRATADSLGLFGTPAASVLLATAVAPAARVAAPIPTTTSTTSTTTSTTTPTTSTTATTSTTSTASTSTTTSSSTTSTTVAAPQTAPPGDGGPFAIGDLVWLDTNGDGLQDPATDPGLEGVVVRLIDGGGTEVARDLTDRDGAYELLAPTAGTYVVEVELPVGYDLTRAHQGFDETLDSDLTTPSQPRGDVRTVRTDPFRAGDDSATQDIELDVDLGLVVVPPVAVRAADHGHGSGHRRRHRAGDDRGAGAAVDRAGHHRRADHHRAADDRGSGDHGAADDVRAGTHHDRRRATDDSCAVPDHHRGRLRSPHDPVTRARAVSLHSVTGFLAVTNRPARARPLDRPVRAFQGGEAKFEPVDAVGQQRDLGLQADLSFGAALQTRRARRRARARHRAARGAAGRSARRPVATGSPGCGTTRAASSGTHPPRPRRQRAAPSGRRPARRAAPARRASERAAPPSRSSPAHPWSHHSTIVVTGN